MKTSKLCSVSLILCTALALVACNKAREKDTGTGTGWGQASFSVALVSTGETTATVQESATGDNTAPFYGFVTSDVTSKTEAAIANQLKTISASWRILKTGTPKPETVTGLRRAGVPYRYIVFGLTPDGRTYGTPAEVSFSTTGDYKTGTMSVSYEGRDEKKNLVFNVSGTGEQRYDYAVFTQENAAKYDSDKELLNALMEQADPKAAPIKGDGKVGVKNLPVGKYVIYVYGVEDELVEDVYNPTLQYAKAEFELDRNFDVTYDSWLGNWTVPRGESSDVWVIEAKEEGETYTITGIESNYEWPVTAVYNAEDGSFTIAEQHYINTVNTQQGAASVCLFSLFNHSDGKTYVWGEDNYVFMRADFGIDDTDATFTGLELKDKDGSYGDADGFGFFAVSGEDILGSLLDDDYGASALPNSIKKGGKVPDPDDPGTGEEEVLFEEDFESNISAWTLIDADGDGNEWMLHINEGESNMKTHSGNGLLISESYINNVGPLTPDNWAFTPAIKLSTKNRVSFWITGQDPSYYQEHYGVYIMTEAPTATNIASATKLFEETNSSADFKEHVVEIPAEFDGKTVYIGFRHFNCTDFYVLNLDDVSVKAGEGGGSSETDPYEAWLGDWEVTKGSSKETWTISVGEKDKSYKITGLDGQKDNPFIATYNASTKGFTIHVQDNLGTGTVQTNSGEVTGTVGLYGNISLNDKIYYVTGDYDIATAKLDSNGNGILTPGTVKIDGYDPFTLVGLRYYITASDGSAYSWVSTSTNLPNTMVKVGGGSGGGSGPSEAYSKWLGAWTVKKGSGSETWTITQKVPDASYWVAGLDGINEFPFVASFDAATGGFSIGVQTSIATDLSVELEDGSSFTGDLGVYGNILYQGEIYYITGEYTIAKATFDNQGRGVLTPDTVDIEDIGEFTLVGLSYYLIKGQRALNFTEDLTSLPNTLIKGGSSAPAYMTPANAGRSWHAVKLINGMQQQRSWDEALRLTATVMDKQKAHGRKILPRREGSPARNNQSGLNRNNVQKAERTLQKGQRQYVPTSGTKSGKLN